MMGEDGRCVLPPHGLLVSAITVPYGTPGWDACPLQGYISFFNNFNFFKCQETVNVLRSTSQQLRIVHLLQDFPKLSKNEKYVVISQTTCSHCNLINNWIMSSRFL